MPFIQAADVTFHYRFDGADTLPVLMLGNSLGTTLAMWDPQIEALATMRRVLRFDARGHGETTVTHGPYTITQLGCDALNLMDALRIDRVDFCGLSMGGMVGQWLGAHAPHRLRKLAVCNTSPQIGPRDVWNTRIEAVHNGGMESIADQVIGRWYTPAFRASSPEAVKATRDMLVGTRPDGYIASCAAVRDMDLRADAERIAVPTLVISGEHDFVTPAADGRFLAQRIRGARYVELPAAHLSNVEAPERFTSELTQFIAS